MTIQLSAEERTLLVDTLRRLLEDAWPVEGGAERADDVAALGRMAGQLNDLGLASLGTVEGPGLAEAVLLAEEMGRAACPAPLASVFVSNLLLDSAAQQESGEFIAEVQEGRSIPALALGGFDGDRFAGHVQFADGKVSGALQFVEDLGAATHLVMLTSEPYGLAILPLDEPGVAVTMEPGLAVPALGSVKMDDAAATWLPLPPTALADAAQAVRLLSVARALGAAQRAFDLALDHAKTRRQFGRVIGEFQALQHKLVDCLSRLDATRLLVASAAAAHDRQDEAWRVLADAAIAFAGPGLRQLALEVHHTLGAIGYAEEHEAPRHFRRVHADLVRFGGAARARAGLADHLLGPVA